MILAAGTASRFGSTKQLAELGGRPLVGHVVALASAARLVDEVVVVVGHDRADVAAAARGTASVEVAVNVDHEAGQAGSLRVGIRAAVGRRARVAVILLADEPDVAPDAVDHVAGAVLDGVPAARARYEDGPGHPVAFAAEVFDRLLGVEGDRGARELLGQLGTLEVPVVGPRPRDIDRPEDLERRRRH
ncbi:MAG: nucleotidyltransferase family protein [Nitriliruptor sp.]